MIYPAKILDKYGNTKRVIDSRKLTKDYWDQFHKAEDNINLMNGPKVSVHPSVRKKLEYHFPELYDLSYLNWH